MSFSKHLLLRSSSSHCVRVFYTVFSVFLSINTKNNNLFRKIYFPLNLMKKSMNDIQSKLFYQEVGQKVNLTVFLLSYMIFFLSIAGAGLRDALKGVTDSHCGEL